MDDHVFPASAQGGRLAVVFADVKSGSFKRSEFEGSWLYLGEDFRNRKRLVAEFGPKYCLLDIAREYRSIANDLKDEYVSWSDDLARLHGDDPEWWFGAVSSRNIRQSRIFRYICFLELLNRLWLDPLKRPVLVVVESQGLADCLCLWAKSRSIAVEVMGRPLTLRRVAKGSHGLLRWGKFWAVQALRCVAAAVTRLEAGSKKPDAGLADTLVITNIHGNSVTAKGFFQDRYFPTLHEFLAEKKRRVVVYPLFHGIGAGYFSLYRSLRRARAAFVIPEDHLSFGDYFLALTYPLRVWVRPLRLKMFRGFDLGPIVREERLGQDLLLGQEPVLICCALARLSKKLSRLGHCIVWYENRITERAAIMGLRRSGRGVNIVGAQAFLHPPYFLSLYPTKAEKEAGIVPDVVLGTSQGECQRIGRFFSQLACFPAAALRYAGVFQNVDAKTSSLLSVLVLLSYDINETLEVLDMLFEALPKIDSRAQFMIKVHPDHDLENVKKIFGLQRWPDQFRGFDGTLSEGLDQVGVVISTASSSMVEAAIRGIPVVFVAGQTSLEESLLEGHFGEFSCRCFRPGELVGALGQYLSLSADDRKKAVLIGKELTGKFFSPVTPETLRPFLGTGKQDIR